jgi:hypothetical protein
VGHAAGIEKKGEEILSELEVRTLFLCGTGDGGASRRDGDLSCVDEESGGEGFDH